MRWRLALLLHKWFGWDYVLYKPCFSWCLRRVRTLPNGRKYLRWNRSFQFLDEMRPDYIAENVKPLTFNWGDSPAQLPRDEPRVVH